MTIFSFVGLRHYSLTPKFNKYVFLMNVEVNLLENKSTTIPQDFTLHSNNETTPFLGLLLALLALSIAVVEGQQRCGDNCAMTTDYTPVCGSVGSARKTYSNMASLQCAKRCNKRLRMIPVVLFCVTIAKGDKCLFNVPVTRSVLKCGTNVYSTDSIHVNAVNSCGQHTNGTEITDRDIRCILEKLEYIIDGKVVISKMGSGIKAIFPDHWTRLMPAVWQCALESLKKSDQVDTFEHVNCRIKAYKDVCGYST
ncbi:unnamed protein product, partial [Allacma fusca]